MSTLAKNLLSKRALVVRPEQRLHEVAANLREVGAQYCVIITEETGVFEGLVRLSEVASFSRADARIFADLAGGAALRSVHEDEPAESVLAVLGTDPDAVVLVVADRGEFRGLITAESVWAWLVTKQGEQQQRLEQLLDEQQRLGDLLERKVEQRTASLRAALDEFRNTSAMLSHDVGGPLRTIKSFADMLAAGECGELNENGKAHLERILRAAGKLQTLASDVLGRAREAGKAAPAALHTVDLNEVADDAIELAEEFLNERSAIIRRPSTLHTVAGRYVPLLQIISNLLVNAVKYVPAGRQPLVEIWSEEAGENRVRLCVKDNGAGIAADNVDAVFLPFMRIDATRTQPGSGLGLSIARSAVTDLGGSIRVESEVGAGSLFIVELPVA